MREHIEQLRQERSLYICGVREMQPDRVAALDEGIAALEREQWMGNLLAVIHRDGGHYISRHGWQKACEDGEKIVLDLRMSAEELEEWQTAAANALNPHPRHDEQHCTCVPLLKAIVTKRDAQIAALVAEIRGIAEESILPDGDGVDTPVALWAESVLERFAQLAAEHDIAIRAEGFSLGRDTEKAAQQAAYWADQKMPKEPNFSDKETP